MFKEIFDFLASYPSWVKITVVILAAVIVILLIVFRPKPSSGSSEGPLAASKHTFRIDRIESSKTFSLISLAVKINGYEHRFPAGYDFASYEQNMFGGEYPLPETANEFLIEIRARVKIDEDRRPSPTLPSHVETVTKDLHMRQPMRFLMTDLPKSNVETLRVVEGFSQTPQRDYNILVYYSVK
jgi:hypothetical protein